MAEEEDKKEDKLEFTPEGETLGYISLNQAPVPARQAGLLKVSITLIQSSRHHQNRLPTIRSAVLCRT